MDTLCSRFCCEANRNRNCGWGFPRPLILMYRFRCRRLFASCPPPFFSSASAVRDLGIYIDSDVSMRSHVAKTVSACYSVLRQLRTIRRSVSRSVLQSLVSSLVLSRLDYGNSTLAGFSSQLTSLVTAAVSGERRRSAYLFLIKVPTHHSAPSSSTG